MEHCSRRRWITGSAQWSNMCGMFLCACWVNLSVIHNHNDLKIGPTYSCSSPSTKQLLADAKTVNYDPNIYPDIVPLRNNYLAIKCCLWLWKNQFILLFPRKPAFRIAKSNQMKKSKTRPFVELRKEQWVDSSVTSQKSPNVYKKLPKNDFSRKNKDFDTFTKIAHNVRDLGN